MQRLIFTLLIALPSLAQAEILFHVGFNYEEESISDSNSSADVSSTRQSLNLTAGFKMDMGLFLGVKHYHKNVIGDAAVTSGGVTTTVSTKELTSGTGLAVGYYADNGLIFQGSYLFLDPMRKNASSKFSGSSAMVYDIAYRYEVGDFGFGPQLSYSIFDFSESETNGVTSDVDIRQTHMMPMLAMWMTI